MNWHIINADTPHTIEQIKDVILQNRGVEDAAIFLSPPVPQKITANDLSLDLAALDKTKQLLTQAQTEKWQVVVFGDYDADGVCATAIMWETLRAMGLEVTPFIPHREEHGYGLSPRALAALFKQVKPDLVVTVDNGIVAHAAVAELKAQGIKVIITDHHQPEAELPIADAIVHTTAVCGAGLAWWLSGELTRHFELSLADDHGLDLATLATFADQVPLLNANRSIVFHGLNALRTTTRPGLLALYQMAEVAPQDITEQTVNYVIAPRLNALGRLGHNLDALRLVCTHKLERAGDLAGKIQQANRQRQDLTTELWEVAVAQAEAQQDQHILIVSGPDFHEGVIGLIAGRLTEKFSKPALVLAQGEVMSKGSARSVTGVNLVEFLRASRSLFTELGGHPMAAGFSLKTAELEAAVQELHLQAKSTIAQELLIKSISVDTVLEPNLISMKLYSLLQQCAPFGQANPVPSFYTENWIILSATTMGSSGQHLKLTVQHTDADQTYTVLAWKQGHRLAECTSGAQLKLLVKLELNVWRNRKSLQLQCLDFKIL
jgi:single-stranded-DNA-specific exonuclease